MFKRIRIRSDFLTTTALVTLALALAASAAHAASPDKWLGATSSDWFTGANWSKGQPPNADNVEINAAENAPVVSGASTDSFGRLFLGNEAGSTGSLTIENDGVVNSGASGIGLVSGSTGIATVDGTHSKWINTLSGTIGLTVGFAGTGTLTIQNGGTVSDVSGVIGSQSGGKGTVTVDGSGSQWINTGYVRIGDAGVGTLIIRNGGSFKADSVTIASTSTSTGTLIIGAAAGQPAAAAGTLSAPTIAFGDGTGSIVFNHTETNYSFGTSISGGGSVIVEAGTTALTEANTYTGGTIINGGTLVVSSDGNLGDTSSGLTFGGGTLQFGASFDLASTRAILLNAGGGTIDTSVYDTTVSQSIGGDGGLRKTGAGTLTLAGANTYTGATQVNAGTLKGGGENVFAPSSAFTVAAGAVLDLNDFNQTVGSLAGGGDVTLGAATLTTGGDDTSTTFSGAMSGTGGLTKTGLGTLTLSEANTYSGATTVNAGSLIVNGSIADSILTTVNNGGTLGGNGTLGTTQINAGGFLSPGNSIGLMTVSGDLNFAAGSTYLVEVSPTDADRTDVTGTATLGGTVQASFAPGSYVTKQYTILTANAVSGTFGSLATVGLPTGFLSNLSYDANDVYLNLTANLSPSEIPAQRSSNPQNVANSINSYFNNGGALPPNFLPLFSLTGGNLATSLNTLSGEAATGAQYGAFQFGNQFLSMMLDPFVHGRSGFGSGMIGSGGALALTAEPSVLPPEIALAYAKVLKAPPAPAYVLPDQRFSVWAGGFGGANRTQGDLSGAGSHDITTRTGGYAAGMDYRATPDTVLGFALGGGFTNWGLAGGLGSGNSDAFQAGLYGVTRSGAAYLAGAANFAEYWMKTDRTAYAGDHLQASFDAQSFGGRIEGGYRFATWFAGVTPYAALQAQRFQAPGYNEADLSNGGFGLNYNGRNASDTRSEVGARFDRLVAVSDKALLTLHGRAAWAHDWVSDPTLTPVFQTLPGASFIVNGATPVANSALASAGAELRFVNGWSLSARFDGAFADRSQTYAGTGTLRYAW